MRRIVRASLAAATFAGGAAVAAEPPVAVNVEGLPAHVRSRILEKARLGRTELIHYLNRTYTVHGLRPQFVIAGADSPPPRRRVRN